MAEVLSVRKGWFREPFEEELLVMNESTLRLHALRPPRTNDTGRPLQEQWEELQQEQASTWCSWRVTAFRGKRQQGQSLTVWAAHLVPLHELCDICFGKPPDAQPSEGSSSSDSHDDKPDLFLTPRGANGRRRCCYTQ